MKPPLKLSEIDRQHLQELYNASGIGRDDLPYSPQFDQMVQDFQDRTFKNADHEQVFGAILKYIRTGGNSAGELPAATLTEDQAKQLKAIISRHLIAGKLIPYSDGFNAARAEFNKAAGTELSDRDFWQSFLRLSGPKRRPPVRKKAAAVATDDAPGGDDDVD